MKNLKLRAKKRLKRKKIRERHLKSSRDFMALARMPKAQRIKVIRERMESARLKKRLLRKKRQAKKIPQPLATNQPIKL